MRTLLVARAGTELAGAAITVGRPLAEYVRIGGLWTAAARGHEVTRALRKSAEELAWDSGFVVVESEPGPDSDTDPGSDAADRQGKVRVTVPAPGFAGPVPDHTPPIPVAQFTWRHAESPIAVPYMRQTTDFTCGPAALSMLLAHRGLLDGLARATELDLWAGPHPSVPAIPTA